jgi:hypothetical protein
MATETRAYTADETWRLVLTAWRFSSPVYSSIGATIKAQHWERYFMWRPFFGWREGWLDRPVDAINVSATFEGLLVDSLPEAARVTEPRADVRYNSSEADVRLWAVGFSITLPLPGGASPGPGGSPAKLDVKRVRATGGARVQGEDLECAEVVNE